MDKLPCLLLWLSAKIVKLLPPNSQIGVPSSALTGLTNSVSSSIKRDLTKTSLLKEQLRDELIV